MVEFPQPLIRFLTDAALLPLIPHPYPAAGAVPDWFKRVPGEEQGRRTVKRCPPFLEAMTLGYVIPAVCDIHLSLEPEAPGGTPGGTPGGGGAGPRLNCRWDSRFQKVLDLHHPADYQGTPFAGRHVVKLTNPWIVQTPPGYSTLFVAPLNNSFESSESSGADDPQASPGLPVRVLSGVVETDRYYVRVNLPAVVTLPVGGSGVIRRGTPMVQLFPFRRDDWKHEVGVPDPQRQAEAARFIGPGGAVEEGFYRQNCLARKVFE